VKKNKFVALLSTWT